MVGAAWGFGFIVGPAVGGLLGAQDPRLPFYVAGALAIVNALYGFFVLPESLPPEKRAPFDLGRANPVGSLQLLKGHPELLGLATTSFLYSLGHTVFPSVFVLWAGHVLQWDAKQVGYALALVGVANVVVQGGTGASLREAAGRAPRARDRRDLRHARVLPLWHRRHGAGVLAGGGLLRAGGGSSTRRSSA
jgi:MFS family permease